MDWPKWHSKNIEYFPETKYFGIKVKASLDLSIYATKTDLKNVTKVNTSTFTKKLI